MAKISQREKLLLGYGSNSEFDFSDVFGGPPRCSSQESYQNEIDSMDSINHVDHSGFRKSWIGLGEKPVFGDQIGVQNNHPSQDFFDDIFGGDQALLSCSLSPSIHMPGRNPFSSPPGSRPISPSPPAGHQSASPSKFRYGSLPGKISSIEKTTSKFSTRFLSKLSQAFQTHSASSVEATSSYGPSSLSREISLESTTIDSKFNGTDHKPDSTTMESNENVQFHFSIYKWPNKGIPVTITSSSSSNKRSPSGSKHENERYVESSKIDVIVNDASFSGSKRRMRSTIQVRECKSEDKAVADGLESRKEELNHPLTSSKITKSSMMSLSSLFREHKQEDKTLCAEKEEKKSMENETKIRGLSSYKKVRDNVREIEVDKSHGTSKVKDFVKNLNEETCSKVKDDVDDEMMQTSTVSLAEALGDSIQMVDAESFLSREHLDFIINDATLSEPNPEVDLDSVTELEPEINVTLVDDDTQQPQQGEGRVEEADNQSTSEETKCYERKVKQWSKGKEGNIRALLSTMQYILWADSGWKPIPLAEIIEANAVKKAYQRALLCLHPDKLQQKGATPYQKVIAQKLFDILQEAWEQFNAIGLL
ncbi:J domain-containing protein required for chloroplast accumulation response 1 isoform X3 [Amaranthus tricolor]|uniref:J domain-containing protein required for chloroplast accumulation response 1 isoform X3 n=1 Tax=Amaranthus tricolor TaxID=29722 RepID=UPI00258C86D9|nr:J domain-containing protein required for chloroplast accumulation response 1 isoform X3 [Amaranthus tricolor]